MSRGLLGCGLSKVRCNGRPSHINKQMHTKPVEDKGPSSADYRDFLAEDGGFEPPRAFTQHAFQACAIGH